MSILTTVELRHDLSNVLKSAKIKPIKFRHRDLGVYTITYSSDTPTGNALELLQLLPKLQGSHDKTSLKTLIATQRQTRYGN